MPFNRHCCLSPGTFRSGDSYLPDELIAGPPWRIPFGSGSSRLGLSQKDGLPSHHGALHNWRCKAINARERGGISCPSPCPRWNPADMICPYCC